MEHKPGKLITTDFSKGRFEPHGVMEINRQDDVFYCDITGPFNIEFMQAYFQMCAHAFADWPQGKKVFALTRWWRTTLGSPDAIEYFSNWTRKYGKAVDTIHVWSVPAEIEGRSLMLGLWSKPFLDIGVPLEIFDNGDDALARIVELRGKL